MRFSIISLVGNDCRAVEQYFKDLKDQDSQDFEIILCVDKNSEAKNIFQVISKYKKFFGQRLIVITNTKNNSYQQNLVSAFRIAKGDFVFVLNSDSNSKKYYVKKISDLALKYNVDVLEIKPRLVGSARWKPEARIILNKPVQITNNPEVIAFSYPFIFNKVFKKSLVKKLTQYQVKSLNDNKLAIELNYLLLLNATTYMYHDIRIFKEFYSPDIWLNTKNALLAFEEIQKYSESKGLDFNEELEYARYYYLKIVHYGLLTGTTFVYRTWKSKDEIEEKRSSTFINRHIKTLEKFESSNEFHDFQANNTYFGSSKKEVAILKEPISKLKKNKKKRTLSELE